MTGAGPFIATGINAAVLLATLVLFPAIGIRLWRTRRARGLLAVVVIWLLSVAGVGAAMASEALGNRLVKARGYAAVALPLILLYELTLGPAVVAAAVWISAWKRPTGFIVPYATAVLVATAFWAVGTILSIYVVPLAAR